MPLRLAVIGAQTAAPESAKPYTVYRTIATLQGQCYERLLRYSHFYALYKKLKLKSGRLHVKFPSKTWSRRTSMEDEVIEARQVLLNEFVKELSKKELDPKSEDFLLKMLKIGKYDDGSGRVSEISTYMPTGSMMKSDRGTLDVLREAEEERDDDAAKEELGLGGAATLTATTCTVPVNVTSNATTVLTEDERSAVRPTSEEEESAMLAEQDAIAADARTNHNEATAAPRKAASIPPSSYSDMMLQRPALKTAQSMPVRRSHHVDVAAPAPRSAPTTSTSQQDGSLSPEKRYRSLIDTQLSTINRLISESEEAEAALPLSITRPNTSLALTA